MNALNTKLGSFHRVFCNPPYSMCAEFVEWAATNGAALNVLLVPARTDTRWWHSFVWDQFNHQPCFGVQVRFLKGRVKFIDGSGASKSNSAPFPSAIIVFRR